MGLVALAVVAAVSSSAVTAAVSGGSATWVVYLIAVLALAAVREPDSLVGFAVLGVVFAQWLISNDDPTTAWAVVIVLDRSDIAGNAWLTTAAFAVVIALAAAIRYRTVASDHTR